jgi:carboxymethylenebutenolidase
MSETQVEIRTKGGIAPCHYFASSPTAPAVVFYADVYGIRPSMIEMSRRLASRGYRVLLPDVYYRTGPRKPFNSPAGFKDDVEKQRFYAIAKTLTIRQMMDDTANYLEFLGKDSPKGNYGCVGYCMGGQFALSAAGTFPDKMLAAASIHGARLATDQPDSPHLLASKMKATIYLGVAEIDQSFPPEQKQFLESTLTAAHVNYTLEIYPTVRHGFAVNDNPSYDRDAAERHWQRLLELFGKSLS